MSNFDIFKIGVGPSSSHTLGPLLAGNLFCEKIAPRLDSITRIKATLYGSLSLTGKGHLSDSAVIWGLNALRAQNLTREIQSNALKDAQNGLLNLCGKKQIAFDFARDIEFSREFSPLHENTLTLEAFDNAGNTIDKETYCSIGGGFVKTQSEILAPRAESNAQNLDISIRSAKDCLALCAEKSWNLAKLSLNYELQFHDKGKITEFCTQIWDTMQESYHNGIHPTELSLPGALNLKRRAVGLSKRLTINNDDPLAIIDFVSLYAIAIAEENASGAKVVTAPTNGACAVIPAVMLYLKNHHAGWTHTKATEFLLTAMLVGSLYKKNATISGAEAGCQAEIGSASSMAAAAMATIMGGSAAVACNAAEIAMEHHLGLTCDPVAGLVQIPCIERNAFGAIKAISAARMALFRKSTPRVALDEIIRTMFETGKDMNAKYKETALGGLAKVVGTVC